MKSCLQVFLAQNRHSELWNSCSPVPSHGKLFSVLFRAVIDVFSFQKMPKRLPNIDNDYISCWYRIYFPEWKKYTLNRLLAIVNSVKGLWQIEKYCHTPWKFQNSACQWDRVNWLQILTLTPPGRMYAMIECNFFPRIEVKIQFTCQVEVTLQTANIFVPSQKCTETWSIFLAVGSMLVRVFWVSLPAASFGNLILHSWIGLFSILWSSHAVGGGNQGNRTPSLTRSLLGWIYKAVLLWQT